MDELLSILMEEVDPYEYHASMYNVYFLIRRFFTGLTLIGLVTVPFFQCFLLLVFSTINFIYLVSVKPLEDSRENKIEIFNEICILLSAYLYSIFLR